MERLEAAIKKARGQQSQSSQAAAQAPAPQPAPPTEAAVPQEPSARPARPAAPAIGAVQDAWNALPPLTLDRNVLKKNRIIALDPVPEATAFDVLRTRTLRHLQEHGWRRLAITSPTPSCGKSTLSLNIALSLSRQQKIRTIEMELDMRRPSQDRLLGLKKGAAHSGKPSAARLLSGEVAFNDVAGCVNDNLALVTNHAAQSNASDILLDDSIGHVLDEIEAQYQPDVMMFDVPPVLLTDDTLAFMQHVDCALIVAAAESTTVAEIDRCEQEVAAHTNVMGVVLNKCRIANSAYGGYDYGNRYNY